MSSLRRHIISPLALSSCFAMALAGCGHEPIKRADTDIYQTAERVEAGRSPANRSATGPSRQQTIGERAAVIALRQLGAPYQYGGSTEEGFDCSGLVQFAYANAGKQIPRTTSAQWQKLTPIGIDNMRVGDLLFFRITGKISHVGLYIGDSRFVHAPSTGRQVSVAKLDSEFYRHAFVRAARPN